MKNIIIVFLVVLSALVFIPQKPAQAAESGCITVVLTCSNGWTGYVVICDGEDLNGWSEIYCGLSIL